MRACQARNSRVQGNAAIPSSRMPVSMARMSASPSAFFSGCPSSTKAPKHRRRRALTSLLPRVPENFLALLDLVRKSALEARALESGSQKDARFPLTRVEFGDRKHRLAREGLRFGEECPASIREQIAIGIAAPQSDSIRVGQRQQQAGVAGGSMLAGRSHLEPPQKTIPLPGSALSSAAIDVEFRRRRPAAPQGLDAQFEIGIALSAARSQQIAFGQDAGDLAGERRKTIGCASYHHVSKPRVRTERRHGAALRRDASVGINRVESLEQIARLRERRSRWQVEPAQLRRIRYAPLRELECERRQIGLQYFGRPVCRERSVFRLGPETHADTRSQSPGAPTTLIRRRTRAAHGIETAHPRRWIETIAALEPAINNHTDAFNRQARLSDVGRQYDLALAAGAGTNRRILRFSDRSP